MSASNSNDEEAKLLASVGGTVEDMARYEEKVIERAQRQQAPRLTGHGFPDLAQLAPSFQRGSFPPYLPHYRNALYQIRTEMAKHQDETRQAQLLRLKEQMILSFLEKNSKLPIEDVPFLPRPQEIRDEQDRRARIQAEDDAHIDSSRAEGVAYGLEKRKDGGGKRKVITVEHEEGEVMTVDQRLERIKQSDNISSYGFGAQALEDRQRRKRPRKSIMDWKRQGSDGEEEDESEEVALRKRLREKRKEREQRRKQRVAMLLNRTVVESDEEEAEFDDVKPVASVTIKHDEDVRLEGEPLDVVPEKTSELFSNVESIQEHLHDAGARMPQPIPPEATCPICNQNVPVGIDDDDVDAVLSRHIDECQRTGQRRRGRQRTNHYSEEDIELEQQELGFTGREPRKARSHTLTKPAERKSRSLSTPLSSSALDDLEEWGYEDRVDDWIEKGLSEMKVMAEKDASEVPPGAVVYPGNLKIPAWVNNRLFGYQRVGLRWMWELHQENVGGIVGDEMGLGKTVQHWLKELSIWAPGLRRVLIHKSGETDGRSRAITGFLLQSMSKWLKEARSDRLYEPIDSQDLLEYDEDSFVGTGYVFVTTYENVRRSPEVWTGHKWSYVVLDEGQKIRNPDADITLTCKRIRTPHRLLLSGTPIQNDLKELWTLFDFVFPGRLGTLPAFESEFSEPIKRGGFSNASPMQVQLAYRCALVLKDLINPYLLRRQKKDIKEVSRLPGRTEQVLFCRLSNRQRSLYEAYLRSDEVSNVLRGSRQLLKSVTVLRKICNHPDLVCDPTEKAFENFVLNGYNQFPEASASDDGDDEEEPSEEFDYLVERSGKLEVLAKILPLWHQQGHRVLVFCQWTRMLSILQRFMMIQGWKFGRLDGKTSVPARQRLIDAFNEDESYFALLMTTRTGGVGVNLTGANRVIIYDPDWNPTTDSQAKARSHRFGQKRPVTIYRLITAGTIEEKIYHRQIFKTALTNRVLQDPKQKRLFSLRELRDFFSLRVDDGSIIKGGHGVTEIGAITRGRGVISAEQVAQAESDEEDGDKETLETVMKSRGLAGIFDHSYVDTSDSTKSGSVREMEETAKRVAQQAVRAIEVSSRDSRGRFEPTWTGSEETMTSRFGHGNISSRRISSNFDDSKGDSDPDHAGFRKSAGSGAPTSKSLLAGLNSMNSPHTVAKNATVTRYVELLRRVKTFIRRSGGVREGGGPTTDELLREFSDEVTSSDAAIFRRLLNSIAKMDRGKWRLIRS